MSPRHQCPDCELWFPDTLSETHVCEKTSNEYAICSARELCKMNVQNVCGPTMAQVGIHSCAICEKTCHAICGEGIGEERFGGRVNCLSCTSGSSTSVSFSGSRSIGSNANVSNISNIAHQSDLDIQIQRSIHATNERAKQSRPKNTKIQYEPKKKEFIAWTQQKGFQDLATVTGGKLVLFLNEQVVGRKVKSGKNKGEL